MYGRWMQSYVGIVRYNVWKVDAKLRTYSEIQCMEVHAKLRTCSEIQLYGRWMQSYVYV